MSTPPRIALACSGLGHVRRGNETWAVTAASALHAAGVDITLLGGGPRPGGSCPYVQIWNWPRESALTRCLSWHQRYLLEQRTFTVSLRRWLRNHSHGITHIADPALAMGILKQARSLGTRVLYKDGLLLGPEWCARFDFTQVLAPWYLEQALATGMDTGKWFAIPHLADTTRFAPATDPARVRPALFSGSIDAKDFVVLAVGDYSPGSNKRLDWIVSEFARLDPAAPARLVLAGAASGADHQAFRRQAETALGHRVRVLANLPAEDMARLYQAADVFV
ncbi:MAG TPA: glycosyltransferase, partial [Verrucomicrobiae bacterium]|nr:glycosyltransferase [Verrucomicrobiae bacterium]